MSVSTRRGPGEGLPGLTTLIGGQRDPVESYSPDGEHVYVRASIGTTVGTEASVPVAVETERDLIGSLLLWPAGAVEFSDVDFRDDDFSSRSLGELFKALLELIDAGGSTDVGVVAASVPEPLMTAVGGRGELLRMREFGSAHPRPLAVRIVRRAIVRDAAVTADAAVAQVLEYPDSADEVIAALIEDLVVIVGRWPS